MTMPLPHELQVVCMGLGGGGLLALLTVTVESLVARRASGLRRRRGALLSTATLADCMKLLSKSPTAHGSRRAFAVAATLLPAVLLVGGLPVGSGLGGLSITLPLTSRLLVLAGVLAVAPFALLAYAATTTPVRRLPLSAVIVTLVGGHAVLLLCIAAVILSGDVSADIATRSLRDWPLWRHPAGGLAFLRALTILSCCLRIAFGGTGPGRMAPGLADGPGASTVLLYFSRPLLIGGASALAVHLYLGTAPGPDGLIWACIAIWLVVVVVLQAAITEADAEGLSRRLWGRVMPLAAIDVVWSLLRGTGVLTWSGPWS